MKHPVTLAVAVAILLGLASAGALRLAAPPAQPAAAVEAVDLGAIWAASLAGRDQALGQWRDKVLVLNFWAPWCPPCRAEIPGFVRLHERYGARGLQFVGIALDAPDKVAAYADAAGIPYPLLLGESAAELARAAGNRAGGLPYTLILDRRGNAIASHTGALAEDRLEDLIEPLL